MKTYSNERPSALQALGDGNWHYHYNIQEVEAPDMADGGEPETRYESDTVLVTGEPTVSKIVSAVVHDTYTDEDIALMNAQHQAAAMGLDEEPEDYSNYLSLVVSTRTEAAAAVAALEASMESENEEETEEE